MDRDLFSDYSFTWQTHFIRFLSIDIPTPGITYAETLSYLDTCRTAIRKVKSPVQRRSHYAWTLDSICSSAKPGNNSAPPIPVFLSANSQNNILRYTNYKYYALDYCYLNHCRF